MITFSVLSASILDVLPLLVGAMVDLLGLTAKQAGYVAAADMLGASIAALSVSVIIPRGHWRLLLIIGCSLLTVANAVSGLAPGFETLLVLRLLGGVGEGILLSATST